MSDNLAKAIRDQAIDDCSKLVARWRDDAEEFKNTSDSCRLQYNLLNNLVTAINNLKLS